MISIITFNMVTVIKLLYQYFSSKLTFYSLLSEIGAGALQSTFRHDLLALGKTLLIG